MKASKRINLNRELIEKLKEERNKIFESQKYTLQQKYDILDGFDKATKISLKYNK